VYLAEVSRRTGREVRRVARGDTATHLHLRDRLVAVALVSILVDAVASVAAYMLERDVKGTEIKTYGDALFWTSTQLLTVSSQLHNPISAGARVLDVALELYAITVVATLAGSFGAFFHRRGRERDAEEGAAAEA
jgi:hypothetical protein